VEDVARGRGTDVENVVDNFGQGRSYKVRAALKRGMIDGIKTIESVVGEMSQSRFQIAVPNNGGSKMAEVTPEILALLNLSEDATSEDVQSAIEEMASKELEVPEVEVPETNFAAQFPEHAAEIARLRQKDRVNEAKLFAGLYSKFGNEHGLSSLALTQVEELHLKIADGIITQDDLKLFLDNVASGTAVVDYRELGSTHGEDNDASNGLEAGIKLRDLAYEKMAEEGLSYGDALSKVLTENESLAQIYRNSVSAERGES